MPDNTPTPGQIEYMAQALCQAASGNWAAVVDANKTALRIVARRVLVDLATPSLLPTRTWWDITEDPRKGGKLWRCGKCGTDCRDGEGSACFEFTPLLASPRSPSGQPSEQSATIDPERALAIVWQAIDPAGLIPLGAKVADAHEMLLGALIDTRETRAAVRADAVSVQEGA